jgi:hypothetical protein
MTTLVASGGDPTDPLIDPDWLVEMEADALVAPNGSS